MITGDYIATTPEIPNELILFAEAFTVFTSMVGMLVALKLALFFNYDKKKPLAERLRSEYFTDFLLFFVTLCMALSLYYDSAFSVKVVVIIRPFVHLLNIYAMWRLYKHYRQL